MFNLKDFVKRTLLEMIETQPEYQVRQYALVWYNKQVLVDNDMLELDTALNNKYRPIIEEQVEEIIEENK